MLDLIYEKEKKSAILEWVKKYIKPGTNVLPTNGHYYLYECKSVYDQVKKKTNK